PAFGLPGAPSPPGPPSRGPRGDQLRQADEVARRHRQLKQRLDLRKAALLDLTHSGSRLEPSEVRFDPGARPQADRIPGVSGSAAIDGAAAVRGVLRNVRGDTHGPTARDEVRRVVPLVRGQRAPSSAAQRTKHRQRRVTLTMAAGLRDTRCTHQSAAMLHEHMGLVAQLRPGIALAVKPGVRIAGRFVRVVATLLTLEIRLGVAMPTTRWVLRRPILGTEALVRGPRLQQRAVDREMLVRHQAPAL